MTAWPWDSSEQTDKVIPAFVAALQCVQDVAKNKRAQMGNAGSYAYADLDATLDAIKPELTAKGLALTQPPSAEGVHAILMHSSGQWLSFPPLSVTTTQSTPQAQGSALSYARRYQQTALLNIATEDDDGKAAAKPPRKNPTSHPEDRESDPSRQQSRGHSAASSESAGAGSRTDPGPSKGGATGGARESRGDFPPASLTDKQHRMMMALLSGAGLKEHDEYVAYIADVIGRAVESSKAITPAEASRVIDALKGAA